MTETKVELSRILVGVAGEYFVAGELSRRGLIAAITLRNSRGIDILVSRPGGTKAASIQVKTSLKLTSSWQLNISDEVSKGPNHYYVFVVLNGRDGVPEYHIVKGDVVTRCKEEHREWLKGKQKNGKPRKDTPRRTFELRWERTLRPMGRYCCVDLTSETTHASAIIDLKESRRPIDSRVSG